MVICILLCGSVVSAAFNYSDITGVNVKFSGIWEESGTDPGVQLYGAPSYGGGDTIEFDNLFFSASATGAGGADTIDGTLGAKIEAKPNHYIDTIKFEEYGDFTLSGFSNNAFVSVTNTIFVKVKEVDHLNIEDFTFSVDMVITSGGQWYLTDGSGPNYHDDWGGVLFVDVTQELIDRGFSGMATEVDFTMDNTLTALSMDGTTAFIAKKETNGLKVTSYDIPEPATLVLLGLGAVCCAASSGKHKLNRNKGAGCRITGRFWAGPSFPTKR